MEINVYRPCPCHPDKKIKFCCGKDIVHELDQIVGKYRAKQTRAAIESLDRLMAKSGPRDCLLTTKARILCAMEEYEQALQVNTAFLETNPQHFLGLEQRASILAALGRPLEAVHALQDAMDHLPTAEIPLSFSTVFLDVAACLSDNGYYLAAMQHALFSGVLRETEETVAGTRRIFAEAGDAEPFALQRVQTLEMAPSEEPWFKKADNARRAMRRGQFRKAAQIAMRGLELAPNQPELLYWRAAALGSLGDERQVDAWRELSRAANLTEVERSVAEALAQSGLDLRAQTTVTLTESYEIDDVDRVLDALRSHAQLVEHPEFAQPGQGQQFFFLILDRPLEQSQDVLPLSKIPVVQGYIAVNGRRTDSPAVITINGYEHGWQTRLGAELASANGQPLRAFAPRVSTSSKINDRVEEMPHYYWLRTSRYQIVNYMREHLRQFFLDQWVDKPIFEFDGLTPRQAAQDATMRIRVLAWLWRAEMRHASSVGVTWMDELIAETRAALSLAPIPQVDFNDLAWKPPGIMVGHFLRLSTAPMETLMDLLMSATMHRMTKMLGVLCDELLSRADLPDGLYRCDILTFKASTVEAPEQANLLYAEAVADAQSNGLDTGRLQVHWLDWTLRSGRFDQTIALLKQLETRSNDPALKMRLDQIFMKYGLLSENGDYLVPQMRPGNDRQETAGTIWTPDQDEPLTTGTSGGSSGLWLPGS